MISPSRTLSASTRLAVAAGVILLAGCAAIQPPPVPSVPRVPRPGEATSRGDADCAAYLAQAHAALAAAGAAAGDHAATAAAHSEHATTMAAYHACLARSNEP